MIYTTQDKFNKDFKGTQSGAENAWKVYDGAKKAPLKMQVFGRHVKKNKKTVVEVTTQQKRGNTAPMGITWDEMKNFKHEDSATANSLVGGSILNVLGKEWSFDINDAWVCGGVHNGLEFHCASDLEDHNNIFDEKWMVTVTGRELIGLAIAGYTRVRSANTAFGSVYRPTNKDYSILDLASYKKQMDALDNDQVKAKYFLKKNAMIN